MKTQKHFYRIGEVSEMIDVPCHVLRYWENEFSELNPHKGTGGQRLYTNEDISLIKSIKALLYHQGFTIDGAKKSMQANDDHGPTFVQIDRMIQELQSVAASLV